MKKVAILLSGCGFKDGTEVTESVSTLISVTKYNADYMTFSLNETHPSVDHETDEPLGEKNLLEASSRISRGKIQNIDSLNESDFDAIILPGGYGVAKHFCDFATKGANCTVNKKIEEVIKSFFKTSKPIGAFCIAPTLISKVLGEYEPTVTIGNDPSTIEEIKKMGAHHVECTVTDFTTDRENKIISSPAYMYEEASPFEVYTGIDKAVKELVEMA